MAKNNGSAFAEMGSSGKVLKIQVDKEEASHTTGSSTIASKENNPVKTKDDVVSKALGNSNIDEQTGSSICISVSSKSTHSQSKSSINLNVNVNQGSGDGEGENEKENPIIQKQRKAIRSIKDDIESFKNDVSELLSSCDKEGEDSDDSSVSSSCSFESDVSISDKSHKSRPLTRMSSRVKNMRRRLAAEQSNTQGCNNMEIIKEQLANTYQMEDNNTSILLHGYLRIQILRAKNLRYLRWNCRRGGLCHFSRTISPYVTVHAGSHNRLIKTPTIPNDSSPRWELDFYIPVCQAMKYLEFRVKDSISSALIGKTHLPVQELIRFAHDQDSRDNNDDPDELDGTHGLDDDGDLNQSRKKTKNEIRKLQLVHAVVHKTVHLDDKPHHGSLEYYVEFIPKNLLHNIPTRKSPQKHEHQDSSLDTTDTTESKNNDNYQKFPGNERMVVPGVYFPLRENNQMRFYINADDKGDETGTPTVRYGKRKAQGALHNDSEQHKTWKHHRFFRDVYDSICQARKLVYIVGWSVDYTISLLRGKEQNEGLNIRDKDSHYSPFLGKLLNQKAAEGVTVNLLVWDDRTSTAITRGVIPTRDEELRNYFSGSKVNLLLVPMEAVKTSILKQLRMLMFYTHHQKCIIADTPDDKLVAYVGGIDLTFGRYDDGSYPLFRTLNGAHKDDFHNWISDVSPSVGPREPWHDIHSRVKGPGALDLVQNFQERWLGQGGSQADLVNLEEEGIHLAAITSENNYCTNDDSETWNTQLYRSISNRVANLEAPEFQAINFNSTDGADFDEIGQQKTGKRKSFLAHLLNVGVQSEQYFIGASSKGSTNMTVARPLDIMRHEKVDCSIHKALIHHIRNAHHSIYLESQYFLSSSFLWDGNKTSKCCNLIAAEITCKICEKIESDDRFTAYIVLPMWPEGLACQEILRYQSFTMSSMYKRIQQSIDRRRQKLEVEEGEAAKSFAGVTATDYLNFYCLATRETSEGGQDFGAKDLLNCTRRHLIYCHSKLTIIDDAIVLVGSANVNQRSLDGTRDSELLLGAWQPKYLATVDAVPNGDVHGFRLQCFAHVTGTMVDAFRDPSSLGCVRLVNSIAKENWKKYTQTEVCEMNSYLVPFPVEVKANGELTPLTANGKFPDTDYNIMGSSMNLPQYLTT